MTKRKPPKQTPFNNEELRLKRIKELKSDLTFAGVKNTIAIEMHYQAAEAWEQITTDLQRLGVTIKEKFNYPEYRGPKFGLDEEE